MTNPSGRETQVSTQSVIEVQRQKIAQLTEENILLLAALSDKERELGALKDEKS